MSCAAMQEPAIIDRGDFVGAMRAIASTVAVVTTGGIAGQHGTTASSFCSVSADPPSMLVCLHADSRIAVLVSVNGRFCLNVLPQELEDVADRFAGRHDHEVADRFHGVAHSIHPDGCPYIGGAITFHCQMVSCQRSGSHLVVIGHVIDLAGSITRPLTYMDGAYRPWLV
ncbi:MAG: flavin reductase family protein [Pseudomonadota bacterium]